MKNKLLLDFYHALALFMSILFILSIIAGIASLPSVWHIFVEFTIWLKASTIEGNYIPIATTLVAPIVLFFFMIFSQHLINKLEGVNEK